MKLDLLPRPLSGSGRDEPSVPAGLERWDAQLGPDRIVRRPKYRALPRDVAVGAQREGVPPHNASLDSSVKS
jgi:hypothetical protein